MRQTFVKAGLCLAVAAATASVQAAVLEEVIVSDSIPLREDGRNCDKIKVLSFAPLIGEAIKRIHEEKSVSILFR